VKVVKIYLRPVLPMTIRTDGYRCQNSAEFFVFEVARVLARVMVTRG
jgi:hypothetical protein